MSPDLSDVDALVRDLGATIDEIDFAAVGERVGAELDMTAAEAERLLRRYANEAVATLRMVAPALAGRRRVLEVGSGIGLVANFLADRGLDIVALEPSGLGFRFIAAARRALADVMPHPAEHLDIGVEQLAADEHGRFDLVYSFNVIEHVPDWSEALGRIVGVLAPDGVAVQSCPNYTIPYEPHFGVPLVPIRPALTARVLPERISSSDLWQSLNWITVRGVRRWAGEHGVVVTFERGQIAAALARLSSDPEFRARHGRGIATVATGLDRVGLLTLMRRLPAGASTPMQFELRPR